MNPLQEIENAQAFRAVPSRHLVAALHVPFDALTQSESCESRLITCLGRERVVALVGDTGTGKTSVIEWALGLNTQGIGVPEASDGFFPVVIPVSMSSPEVATDQPAFVKHLVDTIVSSCSDGFPGNAELSRIQKETRPGPRRESRFKAGLAPSVTDAASGTSYKLEASAEMGQVLQEPARSLAEQLEQARTCLEIIQDHAEMQVVLVFDDTDSWLAGGHIPDSVDIRGRFFGMLPRMLADRLNSAAVIAVHHEYRSDGAYKRARQFVDEVRVPHLPSTEALTSVLQRRLEVAGLPGVVDDVLGHDALEAAFDWYAGNSYNLRKCLRIVEYAVRLTAEADQDRVTITGITQAITQEA